MGGGEPSNDHRPDQRSSTSGRMDTGARIRLGADGQTGVDRRAWRHCSAGGPEGAGDRRGARRDRIPPRLAGAAAQPLTVLRYQPSMTPDSARSQPGRHHRSRAAGRERYGGGARLRPACRRPPRWPQSASDDSRIPPAHRGAPPGSRSEEVAAREQPQGAAAGQQSDRHHDDSSRDVERLRGHETDVRKRSRID